MTGFYKIQHIFDFNLVISIIFNKMDKQLSQQKIAQFKQAFQLFDKDNDNLVQVSQLPNLVRSLYQTPTQEQLSKWMKQIDPKSQGKFQFAQFIALMASQYKEPQTQDQLIEAMHSIFKPKDSTITVKEFKNTMMNLGQKLSEDQLNELFKQLKIQKQERFNYEEFIRAILTR